MRVSIFAMRRAAWVLPLTLLLGACAAPAPLSVPTPVGPAAVALGFGETADVVTADHQFNVPVTWQVTVSEPSLIDASPTYPEVHCYPVRLAPVEVGDFDVDVTVPVPVFEPVVVDEVGASGGSEDSAAAELPPQLRANTIPDPSMCGDLTTPTGYTPDLREMAAAGEAFDTYVASWSGLYGVPANAVRLTAPFPAAEDTVVVWSE